MIWDLDLDLKFTQDELNFHLQQYSADGDVQMVKAFLADGADIHSNDDLALRFASELGRTEVVEILVKAGANVHANGGEPLRDATENGHQEVVRILVDAGA